MNLYRRLWTIITGLLLLSLACLVGSGAGTAIPPQRPETNFEVQTATPTPNAQQATATAQQMQAADAAILPLGDAPTDTPEATFSPTPAPPPDDTATPPPVTITLAATVELTPTAPLTPTIAPAAPPRQTPTPAPPREGGEWDFETDFVPWPNPHGEPCPGAAVAAGWTAFVEAGQYGSSCLNENLYQPNVFSGLKSQEITFDFIAANSGVYRTTPTQPGHRYNVVAYAKHDRSLVPVEMFLGIDLTGGTGWQAETVEWFPWDSQAEDTWVATEETVTASGESMTIFIRGVHPLAEQGGKTVIDNVSVTDLGPE